MSAGLFAAEVKSAWLGACRDYSEALNPLVFLFLAATLFALAGGGEPERLRSLAPGVGWVLVLLANMLSLEGLYRRDYESGVLEQRILNAEPAFVAILARIFVQWCLTGLAITITSPALALLLYLPAEALGTLVLTLALGTPALSLLGAVAAALTVGIRRGGVLLGLLVLPLYVPILIFGASAVMGSLTGAGTVAQLYWLAAITMICLTLAPFGAQIALRISLEQ